MVFRIFCNVTLNEGMLRRRSHLVVLFHTEVLMFLCGTCAPMNVKTALEGETVKETVLKRSALGKDDQLMVYFQENSTSNRPKMCAQYFCDNRICKNDPTSVGQFQEQGDDLVLVIHNVNITNSGLYCVSINGLKDVCNFTLDVQESAEHKEKQMLQSSALTWLVPVIAVAVVLVIIGLLYNRKKIMNCLTKPAAEDHERENLETVRT